MVIFINPLTGTETLVTDERKDEYLGAGYKLASDSSEQKPVEEPEKKKEVKKTTTRTKKK